MKFRATALALVLCAPAWAQEPLKRFRDEWTVMGTVLDVSVYRADAVAAAADLEAAYQEIAALDRRMSLYRADSELTALNAADHGAPVTLSAPMFEVLSAAAAFARLSGGAFDISVMPLVDVWGFYHVTRATVPSAALIEAARKRVGSHMWSLGANTVTIKNGARFDLGGIAKGYAVDRALAVLRARGVTAALVNLGGNIGVLGFAPGAKPWTIGIDHPRTQKLMGRIKLWRGAVATSGDNDRFFEMNGVRYAHIIDPRSGRPVQNIAAMTVIAPTATAADALSTSAFVLGPEKGLALLRSYPGAGGVAVTPRAVVRTDSRDQAFEIELD
jgi:thiamine biosynthesis lipoprotein ApbE